MRHKCILHKSSFFNITKNIIRNFYVLSKSQNTQRKIYKINNIKLLKEINHYASLHYIKYYSSSTNQVLYEVLKLQDKNTSNSIIDNNVISLCTFYKTLSKEEKNNFILELACKYSVHHDDVCKVAQTIVTDQCNETQNIRLQEKLKTALSPKYKWLFIHIGRQKNGVKFLVDMRIDVLEILQDKNNTEESSIAYLKQLNNTLRELFLLWFSVGFLKLERVTWKSSCQMLEKISDYEAVHPIRNWTDLKKRMGPDRRCFMYTHSSMPEEPLVILHTALRPEIMSSTSSMIALTNNTKEIQKHSDLYTPERVKAAMFYSISSTQIGLQGIELGNYLIKRVATELAKEFPKMDQFSSLSPIPKFKSWLFDVLKRANNDQKFAEELFSQDELHQMSEALQTELLFKELMKILAGNAWLQMPECIEILKPIMIRLCIKYLYLEKKRGYALDGVANFHLRNGAEMWRINWLADLSARGLSTSCGIMVNYRYYLNETENNSKMYIEHKIVKISHLIEKLLKENNLYLS